MWKLILLFIILSVNCFGQMKNGGFEEWDTVNTNGNNQFTPTDWKATNLNGVERIADSFSGNSAVMIHNWYFYITTEIYQMGLLDFKPAYLRGYYKNIPGGENKPSSGIATVFLTKTTGKIKDTVAISNFALDTSSIFIPFQFSIDYNSEAAPDSFFISFYNGYGLCKDGACGFLYLDDIEFIPFTNTSINNKNEPDKAITLYPNPAKNILTIGNYNAEICDLQIFDATGRMIKKVKLNKPKTQIEISAFPNGIYFYNIHNAGELLKTGKFIKS